MTTDAEHRFHCYAADVEEVVTRIGRIADVQHKLLADAAHALQNNRLAVVEEFLDRADKMSKDIAALVAERPR